MFCVAGLTISPPRRGSQNLEKAFVEESLASMEEEEEEVDMSGVVYDDTKCFIDLKTVFKWGEIYHIFNNRHISSFTKARS
jgi:hypothetical protein